MRIVIFGGGMQGKVIARNILARPEQPEVIVADLQQPAWLGSEAEFIRCDVLDASQCQKALQRADGAVLAVPSSIARAGLENLIKTGAPVADVSFTPDPPLDLDSAARQSGSCCVVDCGVAPGLSHMLVGAAHKQLSGLDSVRIWVGGMPQDPPPVFRHAVYFNPQDLLSEYIRPARARAGAVEISPAPLDAAVEAFDDQELGALEAFLSDGLRSLLTSFPDVPDMYELTLRWPEHLEAMRNLREIGLLEPSSVDSTARAIGERYPEHAFPDVLVMQVEATRGGERRVWRLIDRRTSTESAMSRTTGYTTAAVAMLLAKRQFNEPGVHAPERLGREPDLVEAVIEDLKERGVAVREHVLSTVQSTSK